MTEGESTRPLSVKTKLEMTVPTQVHNQSLLEMCVGLFFFFFLNPSTEVIYFFVFLLTKFTVLGSIRSDLHIVCTEFG